MSENLKPIKKGHHMLLNGVEVEFGRFPNNEINMPISKLIIKKNNKIVWLYKDDTDIFKLMMLSTYIGEFIGCVAELYIVYLPYSRMDRENEYYSMSIKCIADLINNMNFSEVTIREPHSDVSLSMINNSTPDWWCADRIEMVKDKCSANSIFYPDKGASDRYKKTDSPFAYGEKTRDFKTGNITGMEVFGDVGTNVLIVDDLCSRGGTFINAAKLLTEMGAKHICLLVAHCENNIFTGDIFDYIDRVYTATEMLDYDHHQITTLR